MQISSQQTRSKIGVVLWCICKDRNSRLLDETNIPLATAISLATQHFSQWSQVQARASPQIHSDTSQNIAWNPPQQKFSGSKLLWSWSLFEGLAWKLHKGKTISATGTLSPKEAEAWDLSKPISSSLQ